MHLSSTPRRLPAEWEPQSAVLLTWPRHDGAWRPWLTQAQATFVQIGTAIARFERVIIICANDDHARQVKEMLDTAECNMDNVVTVSIPANDTWARDHGPIVVLDQHQQPHLLDFTFDGWGGKYPATLDNQINRALHERAIFGPHQYQACEFVLEGGAIDSDGQGTLLSTRHCVLAAGRNPTLATHQIEQYLAEQLGIQHFIWLDHGKLAGDDTDGHIDTLARFFSPNGIVYQHCDAATDAHFDTFQAMQQQLHNTVKQDGSSYTCVALPWPAPQFNLHGDRLPATYANFLIINNAVLVPTYADPADAIALQVIQDCFPNRCIIGIDCSILLQQFGSLHCVTMQIPAALTLQE